MRISDWSSDVCSSDLSQRVVRAIRSAPSGSPARNPQALDISMSPGAIPVSRARMPDTPAMRPAPSSISAAARPMRSEEHTSELQSLMRISYAVFCLKKKTTNELERREPPLHIVERDHINSRNQTH